MKNGVKNLQAEAYDSLRTVFKHHKETTDLINVCNVGILTFKIKVSNYLMDNLCPHPYLFQLRLQQPHFA